MLLGDGRFAHVAVKPFVRHFGKAAVGLQIGQCLVDGSLELRVALDEGNAGFFQFAHGRAGLYTAERVAGMGARRTAACFEEAQGEARRSYKVRSELAALIAFKQLNLMHELPMPGPIDVIFCRNVVIYFDKDTQRQLFARIARLQRPGQLLFLGHSETLFKVSDDYTLIGKTIYRRN